MTLRRKQAQMFLDKAVVTVTCTVTTFFIFKNLLVKYYPTQDLVVQ
jgi:hypothetical protein